MKPQIFLALIFLMVTGCGSKPGQTGHGGHGEEGGERVGPGFAIEDYEPEEARIKLSEKASSRLDLKMEKAALRDGLLWVPMRALGERRGEPFLFVRDSEGWLQRSTVTLGRRLGTDTVILSGLVPGQEFIFHGADLVRLAELDLLAGDAVAHCH